MKTGIQLLIVLCLVQPVAAMQVAGVRLPESVDKGGHRLVLNGAGIRSKYLLDIYIGALYLEHPDRDGNTIARADAPMLMRMHFLFDGIPPERLSRGWMKGLERIAPHAGPDLKKAMQRFCALFTVRVRRNDVYDVAWLPGHGLEISFNGRPLATIDSLALKQTLFAIWLGDAPGDRDLKKALLNCYSCRGVSRHRHPAASARSCRSACRGYGESAYLPRFGTPVPTYSSEAGTTTA